MASAQELQSQLMQSLEQIRQLSQELSTTKDRVIYLDSDRQTKEQQMMAQNRVSQEQAQKIVNLEAAVGQMSMGGGHGGGDQHIKLIDLKTMAPKSFAGKPEEPFKAWAKIVRSYCNASRPGFRKFLKWIEGQNDRVNPEDLGGFDWRYKNVANEVLYDFLVLHTTEDAQTLVELQDENGLEAWRKLVQRFDPVGESYILDQMTNLMDVSRCSNLVELSSAINRWEKAHSTYQAKSGGKCVPEDWKVPILFKMIPKANLDEIKLKHKYARGEDKTYNGFSRILIELADEKRYEAKSRGKDDMDVDALARREPDDRRREEPQAEEDEWDEYT